MKRYVQWQKIEMRIMCKKGKYQAAIGDWMHDKRRKQNIQHKAYARWPNVLYTFIRYWICIILCVAILYVYINNILRMGPLARWPLVHKS